MDGKRFIPEDKGRIVTAFLTSFFKRYVEYDFTAELEENLDKISAGELPWKKLLRDFWGDFHSATEQTKNLKFSDVIDALDEILGPHIFPKPGNGTDPRKCPSCDGGRLNLKLGRFGAFVGCSNYPECKFTRQLGPNGINSGADPRELGPDPESGEMISLKTGRFGPYVQLGEKEKPPRAGIPKGISPDTIDLEMALKLLALPREVGLHPESAKPIIAGFGRYGPYVAHDGAFASLESPEDVFTVGLNRAVTLIAERKKTGGRPRGAQALKELGKAPDSEASIRVLKGRYGPYVSDGTTNATLPNGVDPMAVELPQALELIAARAAKGPVKKKRAKKAAKKKASTKTGTKAKKTAAGKSPATSKTKAAKSEKPPLRKAGNAPNSGN